MKLLILSILFVLSFASCFGQSIETSFKRSDHCITYGGAPRYFSETYKFQSDQTYKYSRTSSLAITGGEIVILEDTTIVGTYELTNDTIKITPADIVMQTKKLFIDTVGERLIDLHNLHGYEEEIGVLFTDFDNCLEINERVSLYNVSTGDSTFYYVPVNRKSGAVIVKLEYLSKYLTDLYFLRNIDESISPGTHKLDSANRIVLYCVNGWFNMSSIPWVISIEYLSNTQLISKVVHSDRIIHGNVSYEGSYQIFKYDDDNSLLQIDFYSKERNLIKTYRIIKREALYNKE